MEQSPRPTALEERAADGAKLHSPSVARNKGPIADAFARLCPGARRVLEMGAGTGEHGAHLVAALPHLHWLPSDPDETARASINAWAQETDRLELALALSADQDGWWTTEGLSDIDTVVSINMIHIAPPAAHEGLFRGAAALLPPGGRLFLYGPFSRRGAMAESNRAFHQRLKEQDPRYGVRDLDDTLQPLGARYALTLSAIEEMPANNLSVLFEKG